MRIKSNNLDAFTIAPDNDSDRHLLDVWNKKVAWICGWHIEFDFPGCSGITIAFQERPEYEKAKLEIFKAGMRHAAEHCSGMEGDHCGDRIRKAIETLISIPKEP